METVKVRKIGTSRKAGIFATMAMASALSTAVSSAHADIPLTEMIRTSSDISVDTRTKTAAVLGIGGLICFGLALLESNKSKKK